MRDLASLKHIVAYLQQLYWRFRSTTGGPASMQNFVAATAIIADDVEKLNGYIRQARKLKTSRLTLERQQKASEQFV